MDLSSQSQYQLLETWLSHAESKESVGELFLNWCRLSNEVSLFKLDYTHPSINNIANSFALENSQDAANLIWIINTLICDCLSEGVEAVAGKFPDSFNSKLKKLIFKIIMTYEKDFKSYYSENFSSLPKLVDMDYRVDFKQYNAKLGSLRQPVVKLHLMLDDQQVRRSYLTSTLIFVEHEFWSIFWYRKSTNINLR